MAGSGDTGRETTYSTGARHFHWWTVALLAIQVPVGLYMAYRGSVTNLRCPDQLPLQLPQAAGHWSFCVLVMARLIYRFSHGAPADEPTIEWWQKAAAHATHWSLYLLLILVPIVGWLGISLYGARDVFGLFSIPPLAGQNQAAAEGVLLLHKYLALSDRRGDRRARRCRRCSTTSSARMAC